MRNWWIIIPAISVLVWITPAAFVGGEYVIEDHVNFMPFSNGVEGRVVLAGHTPGVFTDLVDLKLGDVILLRDDNSPTRNVYQYRVTWFWVADSSWTYPPPNGRDMIIITCMGDKHFLVGAELEYQPD